jgi:hypothetical protein
VNNKTRNTNLSIRLPSSRIKSRLVNREFDDDDDGVVVEEANPPPCASAKGWFTLPPRRSVAMPKGRCDLAHARLTARTTNPIDVREGILALTFLHTFFHKDEPLIFLANPRSYPTFTEEV